MSPPATDPHVAAAVDVGSNSVHLLVARLDGRGLEPLRDESVLLGLGDVVDRDGEVSDRSCASLVEALADYALTAYQMGAREVTFVGTEPLRRTRNREAVTAAVRRHVGLQLHIVTERQEGQLTYLGVTAGRSAAQSVLVVDIGGGSSEIVSASAGQPLQVLSLASGSARLSRDIVDHDPPTAEELAALLTAGRELVAPLPDFRPTRAVFVGGTATNLARLGPLRRDGLALAYRWLSLLPAEEISTRFGVNLRRAGQLPAGAALVDALLARYGIDEGEVSEASLRDGAIIAAARLGPGWPALLDEAIDRSLVGGRP